MLAGYINEFESIAIRITGHDDDEYPIVAYSFTCPECKNDITVLPQAITSYRK
jgi:hypothetical protein